MWLSTRWLAMVFCLKKRSMLYKEKPLELHYREFLSMKILPYFMEMLKPELLSGVVIQKKW